MKINIDLYIDVEYDYEKPGIGAISEDGRMEHIPSQVTLLSAKCKGVDLMPILSDEDIEEIQDRVREDLEG